MHLRLITVCMLLSVVLHAAAKNFYAVLSNGTVTFYYDDNIASRGGENIYLTIPRFYAEATKAVFDTSVADYRPSSTMTWFMQCSALTTIEGLENLNTSEVMSMEGMFLGCSSLKSLDLTGFDTSNVTTMNGMFAYCSSLTELDLSSFNTSKVKDMGGIFAECSNLKTIYVDENRWSTAAVTSENNGNGALFYNCSSLVGGNGTKFSDTNKEDLDYARVDKPSQKGYFTQKNGPAMESCDMSEIPTDNAYYAATSFLCERGILDGSKVDGKYLVEDRMIRHDLANITFRGLFTLKGREIPSTFVSDQYPGIYDDLKSDAPYYQAAKALLYLDYGDGITPFDRDRDGFFPEGYESRINILKELMEAFNIKPDTKGTDNPFPNDPGIAQLSETSPIRMGYVRRAAKLGIITTENTEFHPFVECLRGEAFLMLARIIQKIEAGEIADPNPQEGDFLDPNSGTGTVDPNAEAYAVLSKDNSVLTFYYDDQKTERNGMSVGPLSGYPSWYWQRESITSVVFDASFAGCTTLTSTAYWFHGLRNLSSITGIGNLKTDNVTNMSEMFYGCSGLTSLDVTGFKTDNVTSMSEMFYYCSGLTSLDLSGFNTANVVDMEGMFMGCSSLTSLDVTGFKTDNVTVMKCMFRGCSGLTSLDLSGFKTDNVTDMGWMFYDCSSLTSLDVSGFKTDKATKMYGMFYYCSGLTSLDLKGFKTDNVTSMSEMFYYCSGLTSLDLKGFKTDNVTNMSEMFYGCYSLTSLDVTGFKTDKVTDMRYMFHRCSGLTSLDVTGFKTDNVTDMHGMFSDCSGLTSLDVTGFKTDNVTDMSEMFYVCSGLTSLDVTGFNTDNVTDMGYMFFGCYSLTSLDVTGFNTDNVTDMHGMFYGCYSLTSLDVTGFKTDNVTNMYGMFADCSGLTSLDVTGFKTDKVTDMSSMFYGCSGLKTIYAGDGWSTEKVTSDGYMFYGCTSLMGGAGTHYDNSHTDHAYARIDGGTANPGYFTAKAEGSDEQPEGDLNDDWEVDEDDVELLVRAVMGGDKLAGADLNGDRKVDAADIVTLVNIIKSRK